jgi:glycine betaine/proline transport system permease protein
MNFLTDYKIPIGHGAKIAVDWLTSNLKFFFDFVSTVLGAGIDAMQAVLQGSFLKGSALYDIYPVLIFLIIIAIAWFCRRSIGFTIFTIAGLLVIYNQGYWKETMETLALVLASTVVSMVVGVPIGIACARRAWLYAIVRPILDLMQTIPTFVYLIPALILFGLGPVPALVATVIFAIASPIRLTRLGIISTPPTLVEAAEAFGATKTQVLTKVELPFAMPQIMAGLTQTIMLSLSMVVIAALVGANGLGVPVVRALNTVNVAKGFDSGLCIVILAIILDRMFRSSDAGDA